MSRLLSPRTIPSPYIVNVPLAVAVVASPAFAASAWPSANRALYTPLCLPSTQRIKTIGVWCSVTGSGTFDIGIYAADGVTLLASMGSTSLVGTSVNLWTPANPLLIEAGVRYNLAMSCSTASAQFVRTAPAVTFLRGGGIAQMATAHPLPATFVPAQVAAAYAPVFALTFV